MTDVLALAGLLIGFGLAGLIFLTGYSFGQAHQVRRDMTARLAGRKRHFGLNRVPDDPGPEIST